ncbi:MAG: Fe-S cluster assembly protein SufD [Rhodospirillales bacterium]
MTGVTTNPNRDAAADRFRALFDAAVGDLPGQGVPWLADLRARAIAGFEGFPTPRSEAWKYTSLARLARTDFALDAPASPAAADVAPWALAEAHRLVFVNGRFAPGLSDLAALPDGVVATTLGRALEDGGEGLADRIGSGEAVSGPFALNTAFMRDGLVLRLAPGAALDRPVQFLHLAAPAGAALMAPPRNVIVAGENSSATVVETFAGPGGGTWWTNAVCEVAVGANASVRLVRLLEEGADAWHVGLTEATVARAGRFGAFILAAGGALARSEVRVALDGEGAECDIAGATLLDGRRHADATTVVHHRAPHGRSRQVFKSVVDGSARSVFQGKVLVAQDAQKTDAHQLSRGLLLSRGAQVDAKPELQIFADDVKCSHGATIGELDATAMFYLQSRGIDETTARALLIQAFVGELIQELPAGAVRDYVSGRVRARLGAGTLIEEFAA